MEAQRAEQTAKEEQEKVKTKALLQRGLPVTESDTYLSHDDIFTQFDKKALFFGPLSKQGSTNVQWNDVAIKETCHRPVCQT